MLGGLDAWVTAIRRDQTPARASARAVEWDRPRQLVKSPARAMDQKGVWKYIAEHDVPYNPLHDRGFRARVHQLHARRARGRGRSGGRWAGLVKTSADYTGREKR